MGIDPERVWLRWISASEGRLFAETVRGMVEALKAKGPNPLKAEWVL
jgi:F420-non-reducing hydrogenase iron-sulfur subunit